MTHDIFRFVTESSIDMSLFENDDDDVPSPRFSNESEISIRGLYHKFKGCTNREIPDNFHPIKNDLTTSESSVRKE